MQDTPVVQPAHSTMHSKPRYNLDFNRYVGVYYLTIYAPMIYTAPCVMFLIRADTLLEQIGGGWALEISSFLGPVKWQRADRRVIFRAQKTPRAQPPPTCPSNGSARIKNHYTQGRINHINHRCIGGLCTGAHR